MKNKFFTSQEVYEDRMAICKDCKFYHNLLGNCLICKCFMKIKARIAPMECPQKYWQKTTTIETPNDLPKEIVDEILDLWPDIKTGRAKNIQAKKKMIELYNTIHTTNYRVGTSCGSCLSTCYDGIKKLYYEYSKDN